MFSAERHFARLEAAETDGLQEALDEMNSGIGGIASPKLRTAWSATEALQFENIVLQNTDNTIIEARALLNQWIVDSPLDGTADDMSKQIISDIRHSESDPANGYHSLREAVEDAFAGGRGKACQSSLPRYDTRHEKVKQRRELMHQHQVRELEERLSQKRERRATALQHTMAVHNAVTKRYERQRLNREAAILAAAAKAKERMFAQRSAKLQTQPKQIMDEQNGESSEPDGHRFLDGGTAGVNDDLSEEPSEEAVTTNTSNPLDQQRSETEASKCKALTAAREKAENMWNIKKLQALRRLWTAWLGHATAGKSARERFQLLRYWRLKNRVWRTWRTAQRRREHDRELQEAEARLRMEQAANIKALRHWRACLLSKSFLAWTCFVRKEAEDRALRRKHEERARRMQEFLAQVATLQLEEEAQPIPSRAPPPEDAIKNKSTEKVVDDEMPAVAAPTSEAVSPRVRDNDLDDLKALNRKGASGGNTRHSDRPPVLNGGTRGTTSTTRNKPLRTPQDEKLIRQMEQREAERKERRRLLEERKRRREQEIQERREREAREKEEAEERERKRLVEARKELERAVAAAEEAKRRRREQVRQLADAFVKKRLQQLILFRWMESVQQQKACRRKADCQRAKSVFHIWLRHTATKLEKQNTEASMWRTQRMLRGSWDVWKKYTSLLHAREAETIRHWQVRVKRALWRTWVAHYQRVRTARLIKERHDELKADALARRVIPRRCLRIWREYVAAEKEAKWRQFRKEVLRNRVKELLHHSSFETSLQHETIIGQELESLPPESIACMQDQGAAN
ncbi:hypothetical protein BC832DRAFT_596186 [Gaertneriomyces semiglobifer]|nr:hypothetical protein BC832DRAFT_596186 [Gaertneriomyces semiglobifer]